MSPILILIFTAIITFVVNAYMKKRKLWNMIAHIPGPKGWPLIGNSLEFMHPKEMVYTFLKYKKMYGKVYKVQIGPEMPMLLISDPKLLEIIMGSSKLLKKAPDYNYFSRWLGTGLLTSTDKKWQKRRKAITPTFHFNILEQFLDVFHANSNILVKQLETQVGKECFNLYPFITNFAMDVICETAMGISVNAQTNAEASDYITAVRDMTEIMVLRTTSAIKRYDSLYYLTSDYRREMKALQVLHETTESVIKQRRQMVENNNLSTTKTDHDDGLGIKKRVAFLDMLLDCTIDGKKLSNLDIREEVDTFMFEGHDTTTSGISFCLLCLSQNPEIQKKVYEEQQAIFGDDKDRPATYKDLQDMKYLELVIKESLRIYPSVPVYGRELTSNLEYEGKTLPEGLVVYFFAIGLQRDPVLFKEPEKFNPERFLDVKSDKDAYTYIPFSAGPRNCIGQKFAMLELKSAVSKVIRHFELLPIEGFEPVLLLQTILKSDNGIQVKLKKR